ncbi:MAG: hypothetical protein AAF567_06020 [Actinomycetota bacterium]
MDPVDRYPSVHKPAHRWRDRRANARAALILIAAIVVVIGLLALFT